MATWPEIDFETYSEAGLVFDPASLKWSVRDGKGSGLSAVGAASYALHPTTEILSLAYDLKDGIGPRLWIPQMPPPGDLLDYVRSGGPLEAWNVSFEYWIWNAVAARRLGWPPLEIPQLRCAMAKARAFGLPGALEKAGAVIGAPVQKDKEGKRLLKKFSVPRNATKKDARLRIHPEDDPEDAAKLYRYNVTDIEAERAISEMLPPHDEEVFTVDQRINARGVGIDRTAVSNCIAIVDAASARYAAEHRELTGGLEPTQLGKIKEWLAANGCPVDGLTKKTVPAALKREGLRADVRRVLEIRDYLGNSSVQKLYTIERQMPPGIDRLFNLFTYSGAVHTGRWSGADVQPQNLPNSGPEVVRCPNGHFMSPVFTACPICHTAPQPAKWGIEAVEFALSVIASRDLDTVEFYFGDAVTTVSGCLRGLFHAAPGCDLIASDFTAIEAVVLAALAGEEWRLEVFRTHGMIYELSASKITGVPFEEFLAHKERTGQDHPKRKTVGKIAELASGYQGGYDAWVRFGADQYMSSEEIRANVKRWRAESPNIVKFWYGIEDAFKQAVKFPGHVARCRSISFEMRGNVLFCRLPSGREITYHSPLVATDPLNGRERCSYECWVSMANKWMRVDTYGGKLVENITQAVANDIQRAAMLRVEAAGYPIVLHVHDEICSEVLEGTGSVEHFESIMAARESWFADWPIKVSGGWRGKRYRKG